MASYAEFHSPWREIKDSTSLLTENGSQNSTCLHVSSHFLYCVLENNKNSGFQIHRLEIQSCEIQEGLYTSDTAAASTRVS